MKHSGERGYVNMDLCWYIFGCQKLSVKQMEGRVMLKGGNRDYIVERNWMFLSIALYVCLANDEFIFTIDLPKRCCLVYHFAYL